MRPSRRGSPQFSAIAEDVFPEEYKIFLSYLRFVNFDMSAFLSYSCLIRKSLLGAFYDRLVLSTITPLLVLPLMCIRYFAALEPCRITRRYILEVRRRCLSAVLFVLFFVYSSVSSTIFQTFSCEDILGNSYLRADYATKCGDHTHRVFKVYAGVMIIVYPIGIPAVVCAWLIQNRKHLMSPDREGQAHLQQFSGIWSTYIPSRYYFEVVEYGRRLTLAFSSALLVPDRVDHIAVVLSLAFFFLFVSESLSPFERSVDSNLYRWGNGVILASMYVALLMKAKESAHDEVKALSAFGWVLIAANVVMVAAVVGEAVVLGCKLQDVVARVEQIVPPVRRAPSGNIRSVTSIHPAPMLEDGNDEIKDGVSPRREDIVHPYDRAQFPQNPVSLGNHLN